MYHTAYSRNTAAFVTVLILAIICLIAALFPVVSAGYGLQVPRLLSALWRPVFWISLGAGLVIAGRFLMTRFVYALRLSSDPLPDDTGYAYEGAPGYILDTPVYRSDSLDLLILKKVGLGKEFTDFDMPVTSFVSCAEVNIRSVFSRKSALTACEKEAPGLVPERLYDYTTPFSSHSALLLVFNDGERRTGLLIDDGNQVAGYFRKRAGK